MLSDFDNTCVRKVNFLLINVYTGVAYARSLFYVIINTYDFTETIMRHLAMLLIFLGYICASSASWLVRKFGKLTYEQIVFHSNIPMDTDTGLIVSYLQNTVITATALILIFRVSTSKISKKHCLAVAVVFFIASLGWTYQKLNIGSLIAERNSLQTYGNFYEQHYVEPQGVAIVTPQNKRNLIMIFAESMESTYANTGYFDDNIIPNLTRLAEENTNFSHNDGLGGFQNIKGAKYTQASLISQSCAIPLRLPINAARFHPQNGFLPKATCLYDILARDGYNQKFMIGMSRFFAGTDRFLEVHGNPQILDWDFYYHRDHLPKRRDRKRKHVVRDAALFEYAKDALTELADQKEPFAFTMMTLDTHFGTEYFDKQNCEIKYHSKDFLDEDYFKNVVSCSDGKIAAFVEWVKMQPFFKDTEIVIVGDHLTMGDTIFNDTMDRSVYNVYINSAVKPDKTITKNRRFTALDTMPTILETMGYKIEGHKLGLGVSLVSGEKTLLENGLSVKELDQELDKQSLIYNKLLYGK